MSALAPTHVSQIPAEAQPLFRVLLTTQTADVADRLGMPQTAPAGQLENLLRAIEVFRPAATEGIGREGSAQAWVASLGATPSVTLAESLGPEFSFFASRALKSQHTGPQRLASELLLAVLARYDEDVPIGAVRG